MREPKNQWQGGEDSQTPHKSHQTFQEKKVNNTAVHHTANSKPTYDPMATHSRTLEVGRPAGGGHTGRSARPASSPAGGYPGSPGSPTAPQAQKYSSHQELVLNKRRHMTDLDAVTSPKNSSFKPRSPKRDDDSSSVGSHAGEMPGSGGHIRAGMKAAGIIGRGQVDLKKMGSQHEGDPHKSLMEFNLKKQQHFTPVHRKENPQDNRFTSVAR